MEWQSIESAPKDGTTMVDLWFPDLDGGTRETDCWFAEGAWLTVDDGMVCFLGDDASHWMPLPLPPTPEGATQHG